MNIEQLVSIMPTARPRAGLFLPHLVAAMTEFGITALNDRAAYLATVGHESAELANLEESLNYSADRLRVVWPSRFPPAKAAAYARQPERIANCVYADRGGNGGESSGDGWRYRGAGAIQLTFYDNQAACARHFGIPIAQIGDWLRTPEGACRSAGWFWRSNKVSAYANAGDFDGVCDVVNRGKKTAAMGDAVGWAERLAMYKIALRVLA